MDQLESNIQQLLVAPPAQNLLIPAGQFSEPQNGYEMPAIGSFLKISDGNVAIIAIGVIISSSIGGMLTRYLPSIGQYATIIAGILLMYFGKNKKLVKDLGVGVLIGGLANMFSGLANSIPLLNGGGSNDMSEPMMSETKETYGGSDGVYPVQPDRRVFA